MKNFVFEFDDLAHLLEQDEVMVAVREFKKWFDCMIYAGFTEDQAIKMIGIMVGAINKDDEQ